MRPKAQKPPQASAWGALVCYKEVLRIRPGDPAATDFPAPCGAVSWALGVFTAEFGMGSGVDLPAMATGSPGRTLSV